MDNAVGIEGYTQILLHVLKLFFGDVPMCLHEPVAALVKKIVCLPHEVFRLRSEEVMKLSIIRHTPWITIQDVRAIGTTNQACCSFD